MKSHLPPGRPPRAWPSAARAAAAIIATATPALLATACSSSSPSTGSGGSPNASGPANSPSAVAYSACMRSRGVPEFPDPGSGGQIPKAVAQQLGVSSSQLQAAERACQHLYPRSVGSLSTSLQQCEEFGDCPQAVVQRALNAGRGFARCMRSHGVTNWPDPITDSERRPLFNIAVPDEHGFAPGRGVSPSPPAAVGGQVNTKISECERLDPEGGLLPWG